MEISVCEHSRRDQYVLLLAKSKTANEGRVIHKVARVRKP